MAQRRPSNHLDWIAGVDHAGSEQVAIGVIFPEVVRSGVPGPLFIGAIRRKIFEFSRISETSHARATIRCNLLSRPVAGRSRLAREADVSEPNGDQQRK